MDHRQFNRRNKNYLKQSLMFFMIFLIFLNSMLPSISPMSVQAEEASALEEPQISKDVDGEDSKEVQKGEPYRYNVSVKLPGSIERYETVAISDEVDNRLTVQGISLFIDDQEVEVEEVHKEEAQEETEEQADEGFQVVVDEQEILLELEREQFEGIADKEIRLQITAQVKEDATTGESIESIAKALINDSIEIETNSVVVIPVDTEVTAEVKDIADDSDSEEANEEGNKSEDENAASKKTKEEDTKSNDKNTTEKVKNEDNKEKKEKETKEDKSSRIQLNNTLNEFKSIGQNPKTTMLSNPGEGSYIDYDYSFTPKMTSETELTVTPGANTNYQMDNNLVKFKPQSGTTVNGELYYTNVGVYNDEIIDAKIEISAVNVANGLDASLSNYVARGTTHPGPIVNRKMTFISQKTGQPIELAGYVSFRGITGAKYLEWNTPIKDIFAIDDSQIIYEDTPNGIRFFSTAPGGSLENDTMMTLVFEPTSTIETVFDGPFSTVHGAGFEQFSLTGIVPPGPSKTGSIIEDKEISENEYPSSREKIYEIYQNVPYQSETGYFSSFEITDELDTILKVDEEDIRIRNTSGEDVTNLFYISVDNHKLTIEAMPNTLTNGNFYNQLYTIVINGALDLNSDYKKYVDEEEYVAVPNTVTTTIDGDSKVSNEAFAKFKYKIPELQSSKVATLEEKAAENTDEENIEVGDIVRYTITTQNTVEGALVENLNITDVIPEGLTYVEGSLEVDGEPVTDEEDNDAGHFVDDEVTSNFGDITDTNEHTVTFLVTVDEGQAGKDINNLATVGGDNTPPDEPETGIKVYPRDPVLEAEKLATNAEAGKEKFEVGDTIIYTIQTRNTVSDSLAQNVVITDELPEGLSFVEGSIEVSHEGEGAFTDGTIRASFGDVTDIEWRTVTFEAVIESGQSDQEIENTAQVTSDNTDDPEDPSTTIIVDPKDPQLESSKSSSLEEKAEGNTDEGNPEVGDTLRYMITTQNTVEDSLVENLVITDAVPEGLTYVEGSLEVDGEPVTDEEDNDAGHVVEGEVTGNFGDITDTDEHTVTFLVTVNEGQAGKDINNVATVGGGNTPPDEPETGIKVYPRDPVLEAEKSAVNLDRDKETFEVGDTVVYTIMTRNTVSDSQASNLTVADDIPEGLEFIEGSLVISHEGTGTFEDGVITANFGDVKDTEWRIVAFQAKVLPGQAEKEIENIAQVTIDETEDPEEPSTKVKIDPKDPEIESEKSSEIHEKLEGNTDEENAEVGDTLLYTIQSRNTIEDSKVTNYVITDDIPQGLEYVEGSLEVDGESVTDNEDDDKGHFVDGIVTGNFGNVTDTEWHTVEFLAVVKDGQAGKDIKNTATAGGDNTTTDEPEEEVKVYPRNPVLESEKSAKNLEEDKEIFEVGDTVEYTIKTRNIVSDSLVEGLTITDNLPAGLEYVAHSLEVDGESVTDAEDDDKGHYVDGTVAAQFGDVTDTEWHTVVFHVKVKAGQSEKTIVNTATSNGDNVDPEDSTTTIVVEPKDPQTESKKSSDIYEKSEGNTDENNPEVGDTILYTIQTRNTEEDSIVKNLVITDEIPDGLEYVEGSLAVDGEAVSDAEDDDSGHMVEGTVKGQFGDIRDTDWHTLEFLVVVGEGQAGKDIKNVASVEGDNTTTDEPEEEVKVYPREPKLESEKTSMNSDRDKEGFEVGDTVVYSIMTRNTVSDSLIENLTITDELPNGLEYIADSATVSHEGTVEFSDGAIIANFGDVSNTEWHIVTFEAKILTGQAGKDIENIATIDGDHIDEPDKPREKITVDPKSPILDSEKSAELLDKAEGNKDEDNPEVGDTLVYTIKTKNTMEDSLVRSLVITDELPEGLKYVEGSLKIDGQEVTDAKDEDQGQVVDGTIAGHFGDVEDTDWHIVEFLAEVKEGQAGKNIQNIALVDGDNVDEPNRPEEEVKIYPRHSVFESEKLAVNADKDKENYEVGDTIIYTITTRNTIEDSLVENLTITDELPEGLEYVVDSLEVSHDGAAEFKDGTITAQFGDVTDTEWRTVTFQAKVLAGQSEKMIENIAVVEGDNVDEPDKPQRKIVVDPISPILESEKSAENAKKDKDNYEVGDTVIYTIKARNTVSDSLVENLTITDNLPDGLEFVEGSLEVSHEGNGEFKDGAIIANFGDVEDTDWRIVTFEAKIQSDQHAEVIKNIAEVSGGNVIDSIKPEAEIEVEPKEPTVTPKPEDPKEPEPSPDAEDPKEQKPTKTDSEVIETISDTDKGSKLPRTATNMYTYVLAGILLVLVGLGFAVIRRKNTRSN